MAKKEICILTIRITPKGWALYDYFPNVRYVARNKGIVTLSLKLNPMC